MPGLIPGQGPCLGCRFGPPAGGVPEATNLTSMFPSLSFSLPFPFSKNKYIKSLKIKDIGTGEGEKDSVGGRENDMGENGAREGGDVKLKLFLV